MGNNFSKKVKESISLSREEAIRLGNDFIAPEHLLLGMIKEGDNNGIRLLNTFDVDLSEIKNKVEKSVRGTAAYRNSLPLTKTAEDVVRQMVVEAKAFHCPKIETEHMMLSILKNQDNIASQILHQFHVTYEEAFQKLTNTF